MKRKFESRLGTLCSFFKNVPPFPFSCSAVLCTGLVLLPEPDKHWAHAPSRTMNGCPSVCPASASGSYAQRDQMSKNETGANCMSVRQGVGHVPTNSEELRKPSFSTASISSVASRSHQRRWSTDFCTHGTTPVIVVRKNKKEPQPPQRSMSHPHAKTTSRSSVKRYSCPPIGICHSPSHRYFYSSSPPPVQTSVITGPDPLGWKLRHKSSPSFCQGKRLSLPVPLPVILPDPKTSPVPRSRLVNALNADPWPKTNPSLRPKPFRRHHSDSSAFLGSLARPLSLVTLEELRALRLNPVALPDETDDVTRGSNEREERAPHRARKIPPPVPEKTTRARQKAQLIAQRCKANEEIIFSPVIKPKHSHQTEERQTGKHENL